MHIYITNTHNENPSENNSHQQKEIYIFKRFVKSPCLHPIFGGSSHPQTRLSAANQWYSQSNEILLNLSMKRWNSACNAQGSRIIIAAMTIYVPAAGAVEALKKKQRGRGEDEMKPTSLPQKLMVFLNFIPVCLNHNVLFFLQVLF